MRSTMTRWVGAVAGLAVVVGCSSSSPTSPGQMGANLPPATGVAPTPKSNEAVEKLSIKGRVVDARTGEALSKAVVVVHQAEEASAPDSEPEAAGATDSASPSAAATGDAQPQAVNPAANRIKPQGKSTPLAPVKTTADDKGNFEIKDLPPGTYAVTASQKGYVAVSYVGGRPASGRLELALPPQGEDVGGYELSGSVQLLSRKPAPGAMVAAALPPGLFAGAPAPSNTDGLFTLGDLPAGKLLLAAWGLGEIGEIRTWGIQRDVRVAEGKDKKSSNPQITLRAVSKSIVLAGKVASANKAIKPRQVQVLLATEDGGEVPLMTRAPDRDGYFRFSLPAPEDGTTYHLVASGVDSEGNATYSHLHRVAGPSHAYDLTLPELPATPSVNTEATPQWEWSAMADVSVYRVRLETTGDDGKTLWEGWTTGTSIALPQLSGLALKHGEPYRFTMSAIKTEGAFELAEVSMTPWSAASSLAPREFVAGEPIKDPPARARAAARPAPRRGRAPAGPAGEAGPGSLSGRVPGGQEPPEPADVTGPLGGAALPMPGQDPGWHGPAMSPGSGGQPPATGPAGGPGGIGPNVPNPPKVQPPKVPAPRQTPLRQT